jgi:hypothetical protein
MLKMKTKIEKFVDKEIEEDKKRLKEEIKDMRFNGIMSQLLLVAWDIIHREDLIEMERAFLISK